MTNSCLTQKYTINNNNNTQFKTPKLKKQKNIQYILLFVYEDFVPSS